jgi:hypothetical protein
MSAEPLFDVPFAWPTDRRSVRTEGPDWRQTACLDWSSGEPYMRILGFRQAADILAGHVRDTKSDQDALIFPFLYMWRQHIELALKQLIVDADQLLDHDEPIPTGHNLASLWGRCRRCLEAIDPPSSAKELNNVEHVIGELHAMDPRGDAFRYARSRAGDATLEGIARLSFADIAAALEPVANFLSGAGDLVSEELSNKRDFEREFSPDWS